jgi:hypothetical protein
VTPHICREHRIIIALGALGFCFASCASQPPQKPTLPAPLLDDPRQSYFIVSYADASTLGVAFRRAQRYKDEGKLDGEVAESVALRLHALLLAAGDDSFASSLLRESAKTRRTVAAVMFLDRVRRDCPKTFGILSALKTTQ